MYECSKKISCKQRRTHRAINPKQQIVEKWAFMCNMCSSDCTAGLSTDQWPVMAEETEDELAQIPTAMNFYKFFLYNNGIIPHATQKPNLFRLRFKPSIHIPILHGWFICPKFQSSIPSSGFSFFDHCSYGFCSIQALMVIAHMGFVPFKH